MRSFVAVLVLLAASACASAQVMQKALSLKIGQSTPAEAIALLGRPSAEVKGPVGSIDLARLLSPRADEEVFRLLQYGPADDPTLGTQLGFLNDRLVYINAMAPLGKTVPGAEVDKAMGFPQWREVLVDPAADIENWDHPKKKGEAERNDSFGSVVTRTQTYFASVALQPSFNAPAPAVDGTKLIGPVFAVEVFSRDLERKEGEPDTLDRPLPPTARPVIAPGGSITAKTPAGTITITAGKGLRRSFTWEGAMRSVEMGVARGTATLGWPGPGDHWKEHKGITRMVGSESELNFPTLAAARRFLADQSKEYGGNTVYTNDGLVVTFAKVLPRKQLNVDVWQILIAGRKPTILPGADDTKITRGQ